MSDKVSPKLKEQFGKLIDRRLMASLEACVRCGICAESCHYYQADPKPENTPFFRAEQVRSVYRSMFDPIGKIAPRWIGATPPTQERMKELTDMAFMNCTLCRRCTVNCPFGVDTAAIMRSVRAVASANGDAPEILTQLADASLAREEGMEMFKDIYLEQIDMLEEELRDLSGDPEARIPVEVENVDVLYVALSGAHTILPAARLFHETETDWCLSMFEAANYGLFVADTPKAKKITDRIVKEAKRLNAKRVVVTDCGHAYTTLRWEAPNWYGEPFPFEVTSLIELLAEWVTDGTLEVDPSANPDSITYHDSCNLGRVSGLIEQPRTILRAVCEDFRDMTPSGENNYCCGGGGGLVAIAEAADIRIKAGKPKADQIKATGAMFVAASCDNCQIQLGEIATNYRLGTQITGLPELVLNALIPKRRPAIVSNTQPVADD